MIKNCIKQLVFELQTAKCVCVRKERVCASTVTDTHTHSKCWTDGSLFLSSNTEMAMTEISTPVFYDTHCCL